MNARVTGTVTGNHVCTRCRVRLRLSAWCLITERPFARISLDAKVTRGVQQVVKPYCDECWPAVAT